MGKYCNNSQCFKEKNYKAKFLIILILKKIDKDNFEKNYKIKKTHVERHSSNSQCFMKKSTMLSPHD